MLSSDPKMVVIGYGYLASYIYPCYLEYLGQDKIATNMVAVEVSEERIAKMQPQTPFRLILNDNLGALNEMKPDIIHIACPPSVAPMIAETVLKPYYDSVRAKGERLPEIYAYPPAPKGKYYLDLLGDDVNVCNIIPNMCSEINGKRVKDVGWTLITVPDGHPWPEAEYQRLLNFFKPLGGSIVLTPFYSNRVLGAKLASWTYPYMLFRLSDYLKEEYNLEINHNQMASAMRAWMQEKYGFVPRDSDPCDKNAVPAWLYHDLGLMIDAVNKGTSKYLVDEGMDPEVVKDFFLREIDLYANKFSFMSHDDILISYKNDATKGGVLEKAIDCQNTFVDPVFDKMLANMTSHKMPAWFFDFLEKFYYESSRIVAEHGDRLAQKGAGDVQFNPRHHAILFGMMARAALELGGAQGERAINDGIKLYGLQRGSRMAQRALKHGYELNMLTYKAFGEWVPLPGTTDSRTVQKSPVNITWNFVCPWSTAWTAFGFRDEAYYYCEYVDEYLVKGFNDKLVLQINGVKTDLESEVCEFVWHGADLTPENEKWIADTKAKYSSETVQSWEYHIAHLFSAMSDRFRLILPNAEEVIQKAYDDFVKIYGPHAKETLDSAAGIDFNKI